MLSPKVIDNNGEITELTTSGEKREYLDNKLTESQDTILPKQDIPSNLNSFIANKGHLEFCKNLGNKTTK